MKSEKKTKIMNDITKEEIRDRVGMLEEMMRLIKVEVESMEKIIYDRNGVKLERYDCGTAGICYRLYIESDASTPKVVTNRSFTTEEIRKLVADLVDLVELE